MKIKIRYCVIAGLLTIAHMPCRADIIQGGRITVDDAQIPSRAESSYANLIAVENVAKVNSNIFRNETGNQENNIMDASYRKWLQEQPIDNAFKIALEDSLVRAGYRGMALNSSEYKINATISMLQYATAGGFGAQNWLRSGKSIINYQIRGKKTVANFSITSKIDYQFKQICNGSCTEVEIVAKYVTENLLKESIKMFIPQLNDYIANKVKEVEAVDVALNVSRIKLRSIQTRRFMKSPDILVKAIIELNKDLGNKCIGIIPIQYKCEGILKTNSAGKRICASNDGRTAGSIVKNELIEDGYCQDDKGAKYSYEIDSNFPENSESTLRIRISTPKVRQVTTADTYSAMFKEIADGLFIDAIELTPAEMQ